MEATCFPKHPIEATIEAPRKIHGSVVEVPEPCVHSSSKHIPSKHHLRIIEASCKHHASPLKAPCFHGRHTEELWKRHGSTIEVPREHQGYGTAHGNTMWKHHIDTIEAPLRHDGNTMHHGSTTEIRWKDRVSIKILEKHHARAYTTMAAPWKHVFHHGSAYLCTALPRCFRGASI